MTGHNSCVKTLWRRQCFFSIRYSPSTLLQRWNVQKPRILYLSYVLFTNVIHKSQNRLYIDSIYISKISNIFWTSLTPQPHLLLRIRPDPLLASVPGLVSESVSKTVEPTWLMWPWWVKIPTEDFTDETLTINDTYGGDVREFVVLVMEVDKVADEVTNMEIDM